ncbi:MAG: hypothetical protein MJ188_11020, partial [Treponema sp.]|nr:hypothetical protein [Treponema sp.]
LAKDSNFFEHNNWNIAQSTEILGWYENEDFSGNAVTKIPAGNTADKTYYAKFNPKIRISSWKESDGSENHHYNTTIPVQVLLPGKNFVPKAGDTITVKFEATISHDLDGWGGLRLVDVTNGWDLIAQDWNEMKTDGKKLSKTFSIKIDDNAKLPSLENLCFDFGYDKEAYDGIITFSDWKFEVVD